MASDIHDGVLQDQIRLSWKLEEYHKDIPDVDMKKIINEVYEDVQIIFMSFVKHVITYVLHFYMN
ncbi:hypothetical protein ACO1C4_20245 [Bacillus cereus]|uniref:hypothetical protein n=1 Tax=Bacillus cereus TaxID=1396 RepID=UPI003BF68951